MQLVAYGHKNIEGTHKNALAITQQASVIPRGDQVIGTRARFDPEAIAALTRVARKLKITLKTHTHEVTITGEANPHYLPGSEIIIRKDTTRTPSTIIIKADKSAADLPRKIIETLKNPQEKLTIVIERVD